MRENERREKRSVLLGFNTLSKKRAKNYITKAVKKRLSPFVVVVVVVLVERKKREGKRERVHLVLTWYDGRPLFVVFSRSILCFFCKLLSTKFDCVMTHRLGRWILFCCA